MLQSSSTDVTIKANSVSSNKVRCTGKKVGKYGVVQYSVGVGVTPAMIPSSAIEDLRFIYDAGAVPASDERQQLLYQLQ